MSYFIKQACFKKTLTCVFQSLHSIQRIISSSVVSNKFRSGFSLNLVLTNGLFESCHPIVVSSRTQCTDAPYPPPLPQRLPQPHRKSVQDKPVDYLPFSWTRPPKFNIYEQSGDFIKIAYPDLNLVKQDFILSKRLKNSSEQVKTIFSLKTADLLELRAAEEELLIKKVQLHPVDFDSLEVKIAKHTGKIRHLFRVFSKAKKPRRFHAYLQQAIQQRNKFLLVLYKTDRERFNWVIKQLNLEFKAPQMALQPERFCRKGDLRRLTREYCAKMRSDKLTAYHEELKSMQEAFLKEKEETLAWIAKEEKELGVTETKPKDYLYFDLETY